jgi:hypothetical protein
MNHLASHSTNTSEVGGDEFNSSWVGPHVKAHWDYGWAKELSKNPSFAMESLEKSI